MAGRAGRRTRGEASKPDAAKSYAHPEAQSLLRPDVGTQAHFRKKKPPKTYRYDSSLSPALDWDGQNPARALGEWLLGLIEEAAALPAPHEFEAPRTMRWRDGVVEIRSLQDAVDQLKRLERPFLDWAGKAERLSFDVPTLPLFVHERLSTKAILETLKGHRRDKQLTMMELFSDPQRPIHDQVLRAYEYPDKWVNRLILGDSLVVMNSLLHYESLGGQVQMIYMDPPYGVRFGSNFQPFVRKRDVKHNDDEDMTREPEMVKAYRDTWELGLHSYLTYLRDRLLLSRELLSPSGSIFVQISDENVHHVREVLDEVFGRDNFCALITFRKKMMPLGSDVTESVSDYLIWYARDRARAKFRPLFRPKPAEGDPSWSHVELLDGSRRRLTREEVDDHSLLPEGARVFQPISMLPAQYRPNQDFPFEYEGVTYPPPKGSCWKTDRPGMEKLAALKRLHPSGSTLRYVLYHQDYPVGRFTNLWADTGGADDQVYVVQTNTEVVRRCALMTTDPGDLVLDPTCGSGTTAYVAELWGRRWIAIDTSRVPLALARQRLLVATFPWFELADNQRGPVGGFVYKRRQNQEGEEVGGIVPHVTLQSITNDDPPVEEVLVHRPEVVSGVVRVTGSFCVEATIPTPVDWDADGVEDSGVSIEGYGSFVDRMLEVLRKSPVLHLGGGKTVTLRNVRLPAKTLSLSAEAIVSGAGEGMMSRDGSDEAGGYEIGQTEDVVAEPDRTRPRALSGTPVALVFGPESGAVSEKLVFEAAREAHAKSYAHLYVIGFAIQPNARELVEKCDAVVGIPATYVQATPDLMMGDLLKNMRSSQIFSVCGLPEVEVREARPERKSDLPRYQVELKGLDVFDPVSMDTDHRAGNDVPAWLLDTDYNGLCFHVCQAFFPRTAAWDDLKRSLRGEFEDAVWEHLAGTTSAPFEAGEHRQVAVKVIDDRGNELLVVKRLPKAGR